MKSFEDFNNISEQRFAFNGALAYPDILNFQEIDYDATLTQPCKFLTTIPDDTKVRLNDKGYIQFFQSDRLTCTSYVIDVYDQNGFSQQYIVDLSSQNVTDNMLAISIAPADLNAIPLSSILSLPQRGLPIIQECDLEYEVYLQGNLGCSIGGTQVAQFDHPLSNGTFLGSNMLVTNWWAQNLFTEMFVEVNTFEIGGIPQLISPTQLGGYLRATVTAQNKEDIYADAVETMTGLAIRNSTEISNASALAILGQPHSIEIDFDQDFLLKTRIIMKRKGIGNWEFYTTFKDSIFEICYKWDNKRCEWTYTVSNIPRAGFIGVQGGTGVTPTIELSEHKKFKMDWTCCSYTGARLIFQDRLGSMAGFNFTLKKFDELVISSDAFEQDKFDITRDEQSRGFTTIQSSYNETVTINTDFITQEEYTYLTEAMTNPNCFLQIDLDGTAPFKGSGNEVFPATIIPKSVKLQNKENDKLIRVTMSLKLNGTNYTQRN